jgi:hypothetical protein
MTSGFEQKLARTIIVRDEFVETNEQSFEFSSSADF